MTHERWERLAVLYEDGELEGQEAVDFAEHLAECEDCRALLSLDRSFSVALVAELDASYPEGLEARLQSKRAGRPGSSPARIADRLRSLEIRLPAPLAAAAALLLFFAGALGGRLSDPKGATGPSFIAQGEGIDAGFNEAQDEVRVLLDKARTILVSLATAHPDEQGDFNLGTERTASADLMLDVRLLAYDADDSGNEALGSLIRDLEAILLDVATWQGGADADRVAVVQGGIRERALIYRLNTYTN